MRLIRRLSWLLGLSVLALSPRLALATGSASGGDYPDETGSVTTTTGSAESGTGATDPDDGATEGNEGSGGRGDDDDKSCSIAASGTPAPWAMGLALVGLWARRRRD